MPTSQKGLFTDILIDGYRLSTKIKDIKPAASYDELEASGYTQHHSQMKGQGNGVVTLDGYFDKTSGSIHTALSSVPDEALVSVLLGDNATAGLGDTIYSLLSNQSNYDVFADLADLIAVNAKFAAKGGNAPNFGKLLQFGTVTVTGNTSSIDNGASSSFGGVGITHLYSVSPGDTITLKIQHSPDNLAWADLITFSTLNGSAIGAERKAASGNVDRYIRASWVISGTDPSFDICLAFARAQNAN